MSILKDRDRCGKPSKIHAYFDKIGFWIEQPFNKDDEAYIKSQCGPGGTDINLERWKRRSRFDPELIQRVEARQPTEELLAFLSTVPGLHLNMVEFTLDLVFENEEHRDAALEFIDRYIVKKGHRGSVRYFKGTRYTDDRGAPTNLVVYPLSVAKMTGDPHCLHIEWRVCRIGVLRRMGIDGIEDMLIFDHRGLWKSKLRLRRIGDFARLGRLYSNGLMKKKSKRTPRKPRVYKTTGGFEYHTDKRLGQTLLRIEQTVQSVIDLANKRKISVTPCLSAMDNAAFLPNARMKTKNSQSGQRDMHHKNDMST